MKLVGQAYWWWKDSHIDHLRTLYAPHLLYVSEADYNELNVKQELESRSFVDICTDLLDEI